MQCNLVEQKTGVHTSNMSIVLVASLTRGLGRIQTGAFWSVLNATWYHFTDSTVRWEWCE